MNRIFKGLQSLWSSFAKSVAVAAALSVAATPTLVSAQAATTSTMVAAQTASSPGTVATAGTPARPIRPTIYTDGDEMSARDFFGYREYIRGIPTTEANYDLLKKYGCFLGPQAFAASITARFIENGEMCQKSMFDKLDGLNKEGTPLTITYLSGGTATVVKSIKGINVGQNYLQISEYSLAANSDGKALSTTYNFHANGGQYMAQMLSSLPGTILGATLPAIAMKAIGGGCNSECQRGTVNILTAVTSSEAAAGLQSVQNTTVGTPGCAAAGAPCATNSTTSTHTRD